MVLQSKVMAATASNTHTGKHRPDHQIEKYRLELNWSKILDKLKSTKVSGLICYSLSEKEEILQYFFFEKNIQNSWKQKHN